MTGKLDNLDYYTLLGVEDSASDDEIKRAFRHFARRYHPDRFVDQGEERAERAAQIYRRGSEAFQTLTNEKARAAYDQMLQGGKVRMSAEERDRAIRGQPEEPKKEAPIKSPQAIAYFKEGVRLGNEGDWRGAWKQLKAACDIEPGNAFLESRLQHVDRKLRSW